MILSPPYVSSEGFIHSHENHVAFGDKTIGMFAGIALLINNITGWEFHPRVRSSPPLDPAPFWGKLIA